MTTTAPEALAHRVMTICADCGQCREMLADAPCPYFPRLFTLSDRVRKHSEKPSSQDLKGLVDLCNACGQCPCQSIQVQIRQAKDAFVDRDGLPLRVRLVEDVQLVGRLCGTFPELTNFLLRTEPVARLLKQALGVHGERKLPAFPIERFDAWVRAKGLDRTRESPGRKVAYFVGCTARYMFPEVAKATVAVLEANGVSVHVPEQQCCGMPTYLEGDRYRTFKLAESNLTVLQRCIEAGYDIVTACPTCSFALKSVLARGAQYSPDWRRHVTDIAAAVNGDTGEISDQLAIEAKSHTGRANATSEDFRKPWVINQILGRRYSGEAHDEGYFAALDAELRILVASHTWELGEYLRDMNRDGHLKPAGALPPERLAYFPPCHLREQGIGQPWAEILAEAPGAEIDTVGDINDCCGLGGVMGFKTGFHDVSLAMGAGLMQRTRAKAPDRIVTECLGCRLQFTQMLDYPVSHPVEVLAEAYRVGAEASVEAGRP
ncbi:MAG: heterodisulfide reductase-related iron-sulfur binding cluster [Ancalomicrobiaceae bacterium]|nr:heterodisulfide reductase-related iron-sulfur binding cluster [Ancalomicrobiaceae bacterium]